MAKKKVKKKVAKKRPVSKKKVSKSKPLAKSRGVRKSVVSARGESRIPVFVKVISIIYYIAAFLTIFIAVTLIAGSLFGSAVVASVGVDKILALSTETNPIDAALIPIVLSSLFIGGIIILAFGIFQIFVGRALWKGKNWARVLTIIFMALGFLTALAHLDFFTMIVSILIGAYLWFDKKVKAAFLR